MKSCIKKICCHIYIGQLALLAVLSAGWWGIMYPNFSMSEATFQVLEEDSQTEGEKAAGRESDKSREEVFFEMLEAEPGEIEIESKFLEMIMGKR